MPDKRFKSVVRTIPFWKAVRCLLRHFYWERTETIYIEIDPDSPEYHGAEFGLLMYTVSAYGVPATIMARLPEKKKCRTVNPALVHERSCVICGNTVPVSEGYTRITVDSRQEWIHGACLSKSQKTWECEKCAG